MDLNVHVLLVHEMPGVGGQEARFSCDFSAFFACPDGATPGELLNRGIYSEVVRSCTFEPGPSRTAAYRRYEVFRSRLPWKPFLPKPHVNPAIPSSSFLAGGSVQRWSMA